MKLHRLLARPFGSLIVLAALLLATLVPSLLTAGEIQRGIFFKAESNAGTAWLLGSVHMANESFYPLPTAVMNAYEQSPVLMVEMDQDSVPLTEQQAIMARTIMYPEGQSLSDSLEPEQRRLLQELLKDAGLALTAVDRFRPGFVAVMVAAMQAERLGYEAENGIDLHLIRKARGNKPILSIETFEEQMALMAELPEDDASVEEFFPTLEDTREMWEGIEDAWKQGDTDALYEAAIGEPLRDNPEAAPLYEALFFRRNRTMAKAISDCVGLHGNCFVVVGAGHLVGRQSVPAYLEDKGFRVTQF